MPALTTAATTLAYEVRGVGDDVVLIQGAGVPGCGWAPQVAALPDHRCLSFDHRGMGGSPPAPFTLDDLVDDTLALMDHLGMRRPHLVGHSMGGILCHQLAQRHPDRVRSLALLCTFPTGADAAGLTWTMFQLGVRTRVGTRRMRRHAFLEMVTSPAERAGADLDALADRYAPIFGRDLADQPPAVLAQVRAMSRHTSPGDLSTLSHLPTLIVSATDDVVAPPRNGRTLAAAMPWATYHEIPGGHGVTASDPDRINRLLRAHLSAAP